VFFQKGPVGQQILGKIFKVEPGQRDPGCDLIGPLLPQGVGTPQIGETAGEENEIGVIHFAKLRYGDYIPLILRIIAPIMTEVKKGGGGMITFDRLWKTMKEKGVSTYQLRETGGIDSKTVRRLRANENVETKTLDRLCAALDCGLEDIAEYKKDGADPA